MSEVKVLTSREKQIESMKARWQDPEYRANVAAGRAKAKEAKAAAAAAAPAAAPAEPQA